MDMESRSYIQNLSKLVKEGKVKMNVIDEAVKRILKKKFERWVYLMTLFGFAMNSGKSNNGTMKTI